VTVDQLARSLCLEVEEAAAILAGLGAHGLAEPDPTGSWSTTPAGAGLAASWNAAFDLACARGYELDEAAAIAVAALLAA
jgi:DNA-binding IclR family transcriptional regulator